MTPKRIRQIKDIQTNHGWFIVDSLRYPHRTGPTWCHREINEAQAKEGLELAAQLPQDYDKLMAVLATCGFKITRYRAESTYPIRVEHQVGGHRSLGSIAWYDPWLGLAAILFAYLHDTNPFPGFDKQE